MNEPIPDNPILPNAQYVLGNLIDEVDVNDIREIQLSAIRAFCNEIERRGKTEAEGFSQGTVWNPWKHYVEVRKELGI